jgi:hypothetical protein
MNERINEQMNGDPEPPTLKALQAVMVSAKLRGVERGLVTSTGALLLGKHSISGCDHDCRSMLDP